MMLVLLIAVISSFFPATSSYAYPGGYANGKNAILENGFATGELESTQLITDNDESTYYVLPAGKVLTIDLGDTYNYDTVKLKADTNRLRLNVFTATKASVGGGNMDIYSSAPDGTVRTYVAVNVRYISLVNNSGADTKIYELDVIDSKNPVPEPSPSPTPTPSPSPEAPSGDRAILTITLTTGLEKEFDLPMSEVNSFLNWYDSAAGSSRYGFDKHDNNIGPFSKRTDYVIFDKILTFEVSEYTAD